MSEMNKVIAQYSDKETRTAGAVEVVFTITKDWLRDVDPDDVTWVMEKLASGKIKSYTSVGNTEVYWNNRNVSPEDGMIALLVDRGVEIMYDGEELERQFQNEFDETIDEKSTNF